MEKGETVPLLNSNQTHSHSHSHSHAHNHTHGGHGNNNPQIDPHYMTVNVYDSSRDSQSFNVLRPDCQHSHTPLARSGSQRSVESQFYGTYQRDLEIDSDENKLMSLLQVKQSKNEALDRQVSWIINISLIVNILLFAFKVWAYILSNSLSIAASTVDSFLDLCVQVVIYISHDEKRSTDTKRFPVGKSRFEPVGLIICAALMFIAGLQLISSSFVSLWWGADATIETTAVMVIILVIVLKSALWYYCYSQRKISDTVETLAFDHRNDVLSNLVALLAICIVRFAPSLWWADPIGCIAISIYIALNWFQIAQEKIHELVGLSADETFVQKLTNFVNHYHPEQMELDNIRAYHFGTKYLVELDVVLPEDMTLRESHDLAVKLQQNIERMEQVERCFVHCDYVKRGLDEHDPHAVVEKRLEEIRQQSPLP
jgi:cation diffusion facilitator family transporter